MKSWSALVGSSVSSSKIEPRTIRQSPARSALRPIRSVRTAIAATCSPLSRKSLASWKSRRSGSSLVTWQKILRPYISAHIQVSLLTLSRIVNNSPLMIATLGSSPKLSLAFRNFFKLVRRALWGVQAAWPLLLEIFALLQLRKPLVEGLCCLGDQARPSWNNPGGWIGGIRNKVPR